MLVPVVDVDAAEEVVEVTKVVEVVEVLPPVPAPRALITDVYAGFVLRSLFHRHASPWPEKVLGIQEYLSVKSQTVIPTQFVVARQALTVFT